MTAKKIVDGHGDGREKPVSLAPLDLQTALAGLLSIPNPDATKPVIKERKKAPRK